MKNEDSFHSDYISYPKDCYDDSVNDKDKISISKEQYSSLIGEIRCWTRNGHLELNLGRYFKINNQ